METVRRREVERGAREDEEGKVALDRVGISSSLFQFLAG